MLFSGFVVMTAMAGMFLMGSQTFASFGVGTVLVVAIALARVAHRPARGAVQARRPRRARPDPVARAHRRARRRVALLGRRRRRRDAPPAHPRAARPPPLLVALAIPALSLHTVDSGAQGLPRDLPVMQVYNRIQQAFPGGAGPAVVVVSAHDVTRPQVTAGIAALKRAALATGQMHEPISVEASSVAPGRPRAGPAGRQGHRRGLQPRARHAARPGHPRHDRQGARRHGAHHGLDGRLDGTSTTR